MLVGMIIFPQYSSNNGVLLTLVGKCSWQHWGQVVRISLPADGHIVTDTHIEAVILKLWDSKQSIYFKFWSLTTSSWCCSTSIFDPTSANAISSTSCLIHGEWLIKARKQVVYFLHSLCLSALQNSTFWTTQLHFQIRAATSSVASTVSWQIVDRQQSYK